MGKEPLQLAKKVSKEDQQKLRDTFNGMMKAMFKQQGAALDISILASEEAQSFINTHAGVLDSAFQQVEMSDGMRQRLHRSDYIFSGIKAFHEMNEAFPSLLDENGNRKTFEQFLNDVRKIDKTYNEHYLQAEYNFAHNSAEMAAKWEQYAEDGDRYNLQYRTAGDDRVRPEHAALDGVTLPMSDPFWEEYFPPNGWNCRCSVTQVRKSKYPETPHDEAMACGEIALQKDKKGIFHFNPGKSQKTFPDYNPYTIKRCRDCDVAQGKAKLARVPANQLCEGCILINRCAEHRNNTIEERRKKYEELSKDPNYKDVAFDPVTGGLKATHVGHNFDKDKGWYETRVQKIGFSNGHSVILENEIHSIQNKRNVEGSWDSLPFEIAGAETALPPNVRNALKHCAKKPGTKVAVLFYPDAEFDKSNFLKGLSMFEGLKGTSQYVKFDYIYCINKNKVVYKKKPD